MDVLQVIGIKSTRTPEQIETQSPHEDDWANFMKNGEDVSKSDFVLAEPVELAVSIEGDAVFGENQNVDIDAAVPDVSTLPLAITINEHALSSDWNDGGLVAEATDQELVPDEGKLPDTFGSPSLNVQNHEVPFSLPQPVTLTNHVEETAGYANLEDLKMTQISRDSDGSDDITAVAKAGQGELLGGFTGLIAAKADPGVLTENLINRPLLKMPLPQSEGQEGDAKIYEVTQDVSCKVPPDQVMKLIQINQSGFAITEEKAVLSSDGNAKIGEQVASIMNSSSTSPVIASGQTIVANATQTIRDQPIIAQVTQALVSKDEGTIELRLDPAELGKVRITMAARDGLMTVTITAERPETLELLRRNADSLDAGFNDQGYSETQLDFQQSDGEDQTDEETPNAKLHKIWGAPDTSTLQVVLGLPSDGLDIRI